MSKSEVRLPFAMAKEISEQYRNLLKAKGVDVVVAGSIRRESKDVGDIDFVISNNNHKKLFDYIGGVSIKKSGEIISNDLEMRFYITNSNIKYAYPIREPFIKIEFYISKNENVEPMLLFATGSKEFNIQMRAKAKAKGYKLSQYGLFDDGGNLVSDSEKEIFKLLGMEYVPPIKR